MEIKPDRMPKEWFAITSNDHFWMRWRFFAITKAVGLENLRNALIADMGCGAGGFAYALKNAIPCIVDGFDTIDNRAAWPQNPYRNFSVRDMNHPSPDFLNYYDYIFLLDVLEHISNPISFLKSVATHLRPGGKLIINVPAL